MYLARLLRGLGAVAAVFALSVCSRDATGPGHTGRFDTVLRLAPVVPSLAGWWGLDSVLVDSLEVAVTDTPGDTIGFIGVRFPADQDSVVIEVPVTLGSAAESVTVRIDMLAGGRVVFSQQLRVLVSVIARNVQNVPLESAIWTELEGGEESALPGRVSLAAAYDPVQGNVYVFGGVSGGMLDETWEYREDEWRRVAVEGASPAARSCHAMVWDAAHSVVVLFGGATATGYANDTWRFDGGTSTWTRVVTAVSPDARGCHALAYDSARGRVVLFGGHGAGGFLSDTWEFDGTTWTQVAVATAPLARAFAQMAYDAGRSRTVLFGGYGGSLLGDTWEYDGATWRRITVTLGPVARAAHGMTYDPVRRRALLFGGGDLSTRRGDLWAFDGATWTSLSLGGAGAPPARSLAGFAFDTHRGVAVVISGMGVLAVKSDTWEWDGASWRQRASAPLLPRGDHSMAFDSRRGVVVMYGGSAGDSVTWEFDGIAWRPRAFTAGPGPRTGAAMAYDSARGVTVLFGGARSGSPLQDTWEWDGVLWTRVTTPAAPPARQHAAMAFDAGRGRIVLVGGEAASGKLGDTWEYYAGAWHQVTASGPPARSALTLAYDRTRSRVMLFGGAGAAGDLDDTWTYDGAAWSQIATAHSPAARQSASMVFEGGRGKTILFGGQSGSAGRGDIWAFDGSDWVELYPGRPPVARSGAALVFDGRRGAVVLFGGVGPTGPLADTWTFR
jgi:hypothetical protein